MRACRGSHRRRLRRHVAARRAYPGASAAWVPGRPATRPACPATTGAVASRRRLVCPGATRAVAASRRRAKASDSVRFLWVGAGAASAARWRPLLVLVRLFGCPTERLPRWLPSSGCQGCLRRHELVGRAKPRSRASLIDCALQQSQRQRCCSFGSYLGCSSPTNCASARRAKLQAVGLVATISAIPGRSRSCAVCVFCSVKTGFPCTKNTRACSIAGFLAVQPLQDSYLSQRSELCVCLDR